MVRGEEDEGQIDGGCTDLHPYGIREVAGGCSCISPARESGRKLKRSWSGCACGLLRHGMNLLPGRSPIRQTPGSIRSGRSFASFL